MSAEQNRDTLKKARIAVNNRDWNAFEETMTPDFVAHAFAGRTITFHGPSGATAGIKLFLKFVPDLKLEEKLNFTTDDYGAVHELVTGTLKVPFHLSAAANRRININEINLYRFEEGKIAEVWRIMDLAGFLYQGGVIELEDILTLGFR